MPQNYVGRITSHQAAWYAQNTCPLPSKKLFPICRRRAQQFRNTNLSINLAINWIINSNGKRLFFQKETFQRPLQKNNRLVSSMTFFNLCYFSLQSSQNLTYEYKVFLVNQGIISSFDCLFDFNPTIFFSNVKLRDKRKALIMAVVPKLNQWRNLDYFSGHDFIKPLRYYFSWDKAANKM